MGNEQSGSRRYSCSSDGIPFVEWNGKYHFAEPSSYQYSHRSVVNGEIVRTIPAKADDELVNFKELHGKIAVVERGGRVHFPDVVRRLLEAGVIGCIFIERKPYKGPKSVYEGFHSSGRQKVKIPIVRLSKFHADQLLHDTPQNVGIHLISSLSACEKLVEDDGPVGVTVASRAGDILVLKHLLGSKSINIKDIPGAMALCDAAENNHLDCIEILHEYGVSLDSQKINGTTPLMVACSLGMVEVVRALLLLGCDTEVEDVHGMTALMIACRDGAASCVKFLIRRGALVNLSRNRKRGTTALHVAARSGYDECVKLLLNAKADVDIESPNSSSALMEAARSGNLGCVKLLVDAGSKLDAVDKEGNTAEMLAKQAMHEEIEDYLRSCSENDDEKNQRKCIEELIYHDCFTISQLMRVANEHRIDLSTLNRIVFKNPHIVTLLREERFVYEIFRLMLTPSTDDVEFDPVYGKYLVQAFCCDVAMSYDQGVFGFDKKITMDGPTPCNSRCNGYYSVLFNFLRQPGSLDEVLLIFFCKVMNHYVMNCELGSSMLEFIGVEGKEFSQYLINHIGYDSIRDFLVWLLYSDLSETGQKNIIQGQILTCLFERLCLWQRTLSWGVGTSFQRDSVENICSLLSFVIYPPALSTYSGIKTFVENINNSLPLLTDQAPTNRHNGLFKTLLEYLQKHDNAFGIFIDLGIQEIKRQIDKVPSYTVYEGGALSVIMMLMSTLGYHKRKRDLTGIVSDLHVVKKLLVRSILPRVSRFVGLLTAITEIESPPEEGHSHLANAVLTLVTFLKRCIFMQNAEIDVVLAQSGCMPCLLQCYRAHPNNSMLHHELTDVIRFVLLDPSFTRLPTCPVLNSLFAENSSILDFVVHSYNENTQYKGHMTTIGNSIVTLTSTPIVKSESTQLSSQQIVRQYTRQHTKWKAFLTILSLQNQVEQNPLGQRHAPLCDGCLNLRDDVETFVSNALNNDITMTGHLEVIFNETPHHHCKVNVHEDYIKGFLYKKDKKHDHIPIPEPTFASSFIPFPVPMPFHALTFTLTYFGLCRRCNKLWYCDTLQTPNWNTRMKWVIPTSIRKWYSFGTSEGPRGGAHGIQFSTRGYKNFLVLTDTWGRQEQWAHAIKESVSGGLRQIAQNIGSDSAKAIEIDNEIDIPDSNLDVKMSMGRKIRSYSSSANDNIRSSPSRLMNITQFPKKEHNTNVIGERHKIQDYYLSLNKNKESAGIRHVVSTSDLQRLERESINRR